MPRMYDNMYQGLVLWPLPNTEDYKLDVRSAHNHDTGCKQMLQGATVVECTNVARYFFDHYVADEESLHRFFDDLKACCPPYKKTWFEWRVDDDAKRLGSQAKRMGVLLYGTLKEEAEAMFKQHVPWAEATPQRIRRWAANPRCKWVLVGFVFLEFDSLQMRGPYAHFDLSVDHEGAHIDSFIAHTSDAISQEESETVGAMGMISWLALALMNCRNIETQDHVPAAKLQKARKRKKKRPLVVYKTIHVRVGRKQQKIHVYLGWLLGIRLGPVPRVQFRLER